MNLTKTTCTIIVLCLLTAGDATADTEAQSNALFKGSNPLKAAIGKPVYANRVFQNNYHCWDPSLIKVGNTYHLFYPDGSAYALSKANDPAYPDTGRHLFAYRTKDFRAHIGDPDKRWGKPLANNRGSLNQLPGDVDHEDACIWEVNGQYHAIMTDMSGRATGGKKKAVMHWFTDAKLGTNYRLYSDIPLAYPGDPVEFQEGNTELYYRMERPNVYVNPGTGAVEAFLLSCVPRETSQSTPTEGASIIIWPVNKWKPSR